MRRSKRLWHHRLPQGAAGRPILLTILFVACGAVHCFAGYAIKTSQVQTTGRGTQYTWTVLNEDESSGLDMFAIEVPGELKLRTNTVPPPYSNPNGNAYW